MTKYNNQMVEYRLLTEEEMTAEQKQSWEATQIILKTNPELWEKAYNYLIEVGIFVEQ